MKWFTVFAIFCFSIFFSCKKNTEPAPEKELRYVPTDILLKTKRDFSIEKVFDLINSYDHEVELIYDDVYTSLLPPDSLQYVLSELHKKAYLGLPNWKTGGYLHTNVITVFPRLYGMKDKSRQADWLATLARLKLRENGGNILHLHVPAAEEKIWVAKFQQMSFVDWAELNYYANFVLF